MASPHTFSVDDKDLDDAELWAVIDSAAASHSSSASSRSRIPLALKHTSPQPHFRSITLFQTPKSSRTSAASDGEVVQERSIDLHHRPHKIARSNGSSVVADNRIVVAKPLQRTPKTPLFSSPESGRVAVQEISPGSESSPSPSPVCSGKEERMHSLSGQFPSVSLFKECQNAAMAILEKGDYTIISGSPFIKKSGWRKIAFYFNISFEIRDKSIEFDDNRNVQRAEFVVRAHMQGGRFSDGWGSCERREKRFMKPNHDIPSTAETRAKSKACQDLLGIGEYRRGTL